MYDVFQSLGRGAAAVLAAVMMTAGATAMAAPVDVNVDADGVAIHGYDPVAYFTANEPVQGDAALSTTHEGAVYHFSNEANREAFLADPTAYVPQYGGFCAYGLTVSRKFDTDPTAWHIEDGKLYLNLNHKVQSIWREDIAGYVDTADGNWPGVLGKSDEDLKAAAN